jgi:hypothetical protein
MKHSVKECEEREPLFLREGAPLLEKKKTNRQKLTQ